MLRQAFGGFAASGLILALALTAVVLLAHTLSSSAPQPLSLLSDPNLDLIDKFRREQQALDSMKEGDSGVQAMEAKNMAEGDALAAEMQEGNSNSGVGDVDAATAKALRAADATVRSVGLASGSRALTGDISGKHLVKQMSEVGLPSNHNTDQLGLSLKRELQASRKELADVMAGGSGAKYSGDLGLSETALNSVSEGIADGLGVKRYNPLTGVASGSLSLAPSSFSSKLARKELKKVAGGSLHEASTLVGLGSGQALNLGSSTLNAASSRAAPKAIRSLAPKHAKGRVGFQSRTIEELKREIKERQKALRVA